MAFISEARDEAARAESKMPSSQDQSEPQVAGHRQEESQSIVVDETSQEKEARAQTTAQAVYGQTTLAAESIDTDVEILSDLAGVSRG